MIEPILLIFAILIIQVAMGELGQRRAHRREVELLKLIRSLENRLTAKDLNGYVALESNDREMRSPRREVKQEKEPEDQFDAMIYGGTGG